MIKKKVLLTNDDGINSKGLRLLQRLLCKYYDVITVAPDTEKSGVSHSFTYKKNIFIKKHNNDFSENVFSISGSPADCIKIGIREICDENPDIIISGINIGENSGISAHYSGTVAAAREGSLWKIKSFAFSICVQGLQYLEKYVDFVPEIVEKTSVSDSKFFNINFPGCNPSDVKGIKTTKQSMAFFDDYYISTNIIENNVSKKGYKINGKKVDIEQNIEYDSRALMENWITITPMTVDATDYCEFTKLKEFEQEFRGIINV